MAVRALFPASLAARETQSFRCWGHSPHGPPADPGAKLLMASLPYSIDIWRGSISSPGVERGLLSLGIFGYFVFKASSDRMSGGSISSAKEAMRTFPRMLPSSISEDIGFGRALPFFFLLIFRTMGAPSKFVKSSFWQKLPIRLMTSVAREVFCCPARGGAFKQILGVKRSRRQFSTSEGFDMILDMLLLKARAKLVLDAFGMNLRT